MRATDLISERGIERLDPDSYEGGKQELRWYKKNMARQRALPGGSRFTYQVRGKLTDSEIAIVLLDPSGKVDEPRTYAYRTTKEYMKAHTSWKRAGGKGSQIIGKLSMYKIPKFPAPNAFEVGAITVDEDYRGQGLGLALYGIAINVLNISLISGDSQTPSGRKNWINLASIPGCEVVGYISIDETALAAVEVTPDVQWREAHNTKAETLIDRIMNVGAEYLGTWKNRRGNQHTFIYPVTSNGTNTELQNAVKGSDVQVYGARDDRLESGLLARWVG